MPYYRSPSNSPSAGWIRSVYLDEAGISLFRQRRGQDPGRPFPWTYSQVECRFRRVFTQAKVDNSIHGFRRTAGAILIWSGVDIYRVSKFLGHSSVMVTERHYVDLPPAEYFKMSGNLSTVIDRTLA